MIRKGETLRRVSKSRLDESEISGRDDVISKFRFEGELGIANSRWERKQHKI